MMKMPPKMYFYINIYEKITFYLRIEAVYLRIEPFYLRIEQFYLRIEPIYLRINFFGLITMGIQLESMIATFLNPYY